VYCSGVKAGGGVRDRAWQAAAPQQQAASRLVAASELEHGKLRLASSKRRQGWWRRPRSSMASCGSPAASGVKAGGGVRARAWQAAAGQQQAASRLVAASELEHGKLRLASSKRRQGWWRRPRSSMASCGSPAASSVEAGGGVRARAWQAAAGQQ
ncbi:hypothetical protein PR003_g33244, partial [Phytophthora rubi]